jgi:DNA-binding phage protein
MSNVIEMGITAENMLEIYGIATQMRAEGLNAEFINAAVNRAGEYEGTFDLMLMWRDEHDPEERAATLADIQDAIDEGRERPNQVVEKPYIPFDQLENISDKVKAFKAGLRNKVDAWGGIMKLAAATGIPQPSLSRFFNSTSMPRRTTLYKIANVLELSEEEIATDWIR